jgi:hypothetical protein
MDRSNLKTWNDEDDYDDEDEWECCFPDRCLVPHFNHHSSECYDLEMAEALHEEMMREVDSGEQPAYPARNWQR